MKKLAFLIPIALVMAVVLWVWPGILTPPTEDEGGVDSFRTATVARRDIGSTVLATGVIRPMVGAEVQVGSRVSGILQRLNVSIGDEVDAGEILAELKRRGHTLTPTSVGAYGGYQAIWKDPVTGSYVGATEMRKDGCAIGY